MAKEKSFSNELDKVVTNLTCISEELKEKAQNVKGEAQASLNTLKMSVEKLTNDFKELLSKEAKTATQAIEKEGEKVEEGARSAGAFFKGKLDAIKPAFEQVVENIKNQPVHLNEVFDLAGLKLKMVAIKARIFTRNGFHKIQKKVFGHA